MTFAALLLDIALLVLAAIEAEGPEGGVVCGVRNDDDELYSVDRESDA